MFHLTEVKKQSSPELVSDRKPCLSRAKARAQPEETMITDRQNSIHMGNPLSYARAFWRSRPNLRGSHLLFSLLDQELSGKLPTLNL